MPLPPAPSKRAALLGQTVFETPSVGKAPKKQTTHFSSSPVHEAPSVSDEFEPPVVHASVAESIYNAQREAPIKPKQAIKAQKSTARSGGKKSNLPTKLFVLDTNVLLHDPMCLFRFEEHDVFLPMIVL